MKSSRLRTQGFVNHHRKLIFITAMIGLAAYLFFVPDPWKLSETAVLAAEVIGSLLIFTGILCRVFATITIGGHKDRTVINTEFYSICRNPLYFASFLMAIGVGLMSGRMDFALVLTATYLAIFYPMMLNEARFLRNKFEGFAEYEKSVPLFLPKFSLWKQRDSFEINFKLVKRTALDAALALPLIPVITLIRAIIVHGHFPFLHK
ncbi:MAG: isoprenylcysteine carboxylmethyltransferase family protein [Gloeobacteraceae cyanobacterium ES-bin-144]|nr:isoprenylcysteine carboxylmethyltransferase family protein [Verrucomicrobiales bacterium]